jgi:hypothetical protein
MLQELFEVLLSALCPELEDEWRCTFHIGSACVVAYTGYKVRSVSERGNGGSAGRWAVVGTGTSQIKASSYFHTLKVQEFYLVGRAVALWIMRVLVAPLLRHASSAHGLYQVFLPPTPIPGGTLWLLVPCVRRLASKFWAVPFRNCYGLWMSPDQAVWPCHDFGVVNCLLFFTLRADLTWSRQETCKLY